jgi:tetratricopeptide (TPR) repeat protein
MQHREEAKSDLQEALRLNPKSLEAVASLGTIYSDERRYRDAIELYDEALGRSIQALEDPLRQTILEARRLAWGKIHGAREQTGGSTFAGERAQQR